MISDALMRYQLSDEDFLGFEPSAVLCSQCSGFFCNCKAVQYYRGHAAIICPNKVPGQIVLKGLAEKRAALRHPAKAC